MLNVRFGDAHRVWAPYHQTGKPQQVTDIEQQARIHLTVGPFDEVKWFPPPAEGGTNVKEWVTLTDETALVAAKQLNLDVSMQKTPAENQQAIDTFLKQNPSDSKSHGAGFIVASLLNTIRSTLLEI